MPEEHTFQTPRGTRDFYPENMAIRRYIEKVWREVSDAALRRYGLSFDDVARAVRDRSLDLPGGRIRTDSGSITLRSVSQARGKQFLSGIHRHFLEIDLDHCDLGVFGKLISEDYELQDGDRIEIYRPLIADPKEIRRQRAARGLKTGKGGGALSQD